MSDSIAELVALSDREDPCNLRWDELEPLWVDAMDRRYLTCIAENYGGGPVGVETLAAALSEQRDTIEDVIEPFLIQQGFIKRTSQGRVATRRAYAHFGIATKEDRLDQGELF